MHARVGTALHVMNYSIRSTQPQGPRDSFRCSVRLIAAFVAGCAWGTSQAQHHPARHNAPPTQERGVLSLDIYQNEDRIHLLTAERDAAGTVSLLHTWSDDDGLKWSHPVQVNGTQPPPHSPSRGNDPQIAAWKNSVIAVWTPPGHDEWGAGALISARSEDGGKTWSAGANPSSTGSDGSQAFTDVASDSAGAFHVVWLDTRAKQRGLRYARSDDSGRHWSPVTTLDTVTCECCWNTVTPLGQKKIYTLYRDSTPRDMALAFTADGGSTWHRASSVGAFKWDIEACPHSGGGLTLARDGSALHTIVSTGKEEFAGLHHLRSTDDGFHWSSTHRVAASGANHPDISLNNNTLAAAWDAWADSSMAIHYAFSNDGGENWSAPQRLSKPGVTATHPRIVATRQGFRVFWTERPKGSAPTWTSAAIQPAPSTARRER